MGVGMGADDVGNVHGDGGRRVVPLSHPARVAASPRIDLLRHAKRWRDEDGGGGGGGGSEDDGSGDGDGDGGDGDGDGDGDLQAQIRKLWKEMDRKEMRLRRLEGWIQQVSSGQVVFGGNKRRR